MSFAGGRIHAGIDAVLDTALDAVCVMDGEGIVVGWNDHAVECFGHDRAYAIGRRLSEVIIPPRLREAHEAGMRRYLSTGEATVLNRRIEVPALHAHGHEFPVELSITASEQFGGLLFIGFIRDLSKQKDAEERHQRLLQESDHRVKNMLTVVSAIAQQTARNSATMDEFTASFSGRLDSLARAHQLLVGKTTHDVALTALAEQVLGTDVAQGRARFGGPEVLLPAKQVLGLSMILHELYTNSVKYGALCGGKGRSNSIGPCGTARSS